MTVPSKTVIVTGASQGIGAGIVRRFVERGFNVIANSRKVTQSSEVAASDDHVALVDGDIGEPATAAFIVETALSCFKSIDVLVNNAGIFFTKFTNCATIISFRVSGDDALRLSGEFAMGTFPQQRCRLCPISFSFRPANFSNR